MKCSNVGYGTILAASLSVTVPASHAQPTQIEEVIVTAQKREESLQEVPIAISALSAEGLLKANVARVEDLGNSVSGISFTNQNGYVVPLVRGVGTVVPGSATYQAVATYIDDIYIPRSYGSNLVIDYAESVQILKGPQGALYGRNATAGAVVINTKNPEPGSELQGSISVGYAEFDKVDVSGYASTGLGEHAALNVTAYYSDADGYHDIITASSANPQDDSFNDKEEYGFSAKLLFRPSDEVEVLFKVAHSRFESRMNNWDVVSDQEFPSAAQIMQINPLLAPGVLEAITGNPGLNANAFVAAGLNSSQVLYATILGGSLGFPAPAAIGIAGGIANTPKFGTAVENLVNSCEIGGPSNFPSVDIKCAGGSYHNRKDTSVSLQMSFTLDRVDITSITGYRTGVQGSAADVAGIDVRSPGAVALLGALAPFGITNLGLGFSGEFESEDIQQELRFASNDSWNWQWIVGVHYFEETSDTHKIDGNSFGGFAINANNSWENKSISVFGQATFPFTDNWSATVGARYTDEKYELKDEVDFSIPPQFIVPVVFANGPLGTLKEDESVATYLARLEYKTETWMAYVGTSTGFKSGTLNNDGPAFGRAEPEEITSYEVGFKSDWLDGRLRVNGSVFHYQYDKPHISFVDNATGGQVLLNIDEGEVWGADLDITGIIGERTQWFFNMTVVDTEYKDDTVFNNASLGLSSVLATGGKDMGGAPPFIAVAGFDYRIPFGDAGDLFISPTVKYNAGVWYDPENRVGSGGGNSDADYTLVNLNMRYEPSNGKWSATFWVKNLLDEKYYQSGLVANGFWLIADPAPPSWIGGSFKLNF